MVSTIISSPALMMKREMSTPTYASREMFVKTMTRAEARTEVDRTASNMASAPEADSAPEPVFFPMAMV